MKRSRIKRKPRVSVTMAERAALADRQRAFWLEALKQPGPTPFEAHHVIRRQDLRALGKDEWDPRNARRIALQAHDEHHVPGALGDPRIKTTALLDMNVDYAFEVLGDYALDYLRRRYNDDDQDPRLRARERAMDA